MTPRRGLARAMGGLVGASCALALLAACSKKSDPPKGGLTVVPVPSASAMASAAPVVLPAPVASGMPDAQAVSAVVNPMREAAYAGPVGTVRGRIVATGDAAPPQPAVLAKIPAECASTRSQYEKLFRVGPDRGLADALVAVTGYKGYVPERENSVNVEAKDCFYGTRTLALTYGQNIEVASGDKRSYIPELLGEHGQPQLVATPGGSTVSPLYPTRVGRFVLIDNLKLFMTADVIVLKYATHAVTGLDGRFEIKGVPVGPVTVNALLTATGAGANRQVTVEADKPTEELVLELAFDAAAYKKSIESVDAGAPRPSATTSSSSKPPAVAPKPSR